ncbi:MAG: carbohydrate kinase family protein [Anaerolineales bacterium]
MHLDILTTGYPSTDYIMKVNHLPRQGETGILLKPPGVASPSLGGCPNNIAVAVARLGLRSGVITVIGDDKRGKNVKKILHREQVEIQGVHVVEGEDTSLTYLFFDADGNHQTYFYPGASDLGQFKLSLKDEWAEGIQWGVITVGNASHNLQVNNWFVKHDIPVLWSLRNDPYSYPDKLITRLLKTSTIIVMNEAEAEQLKKMQDIHSFQPLFREGIKAAIVTLGAEGSRVLEPDSVKHVPGVQPTRIVDPTGAGDGFVGGLLFGLCSGYSTAKAARFGSVVASFALEDWGCQTNLPSRSELKKRYETAFKD